MARNLKVSKGSFYGYFANIHDYQQALLDYWRKQATDRMIAEHGGEDFDFESFVKLIVTPQPDFPFDTCQAELGLREWGRVDAEVRAKIDEVDAKRLAFLTQTMGDKWKAQILYQAWLGGECLGYDDADVLLTKLWRILMNSSQPHI